MKNRNTIFTTIVIACVGLSPTAEAVVPAPDGGYPGANTAEGQNALFSLTTGINNTAVGWFSLKSNTDGQLNTAVGSGALFSSTHANRNTAIGGAALFSDTDGPSNTAVGVLALFHNNIGGRNTAIGDNALFNNRGGSGNTAVGVSALYGNTGLGNTAIGEFAGSDQTNGVNNLYLGAGMNGVPGESNACYIKSIFGQTSGGGTQVFINSNNKLGTTTSSKRFKEAIKPMDKSSEALFALKPVIFRYKKEIDSKGIPQFGLVAEEVEKVNPDLVVRDKEAKPYSVRYDQVNAMLLNEFLKEHRTVQELKSNAAKQEAMIAKQQKQIDALTAGLQKVSAQIELSKLAPQVALNTP